MTTLHLEINRKNQWQSIRDSFLLLLGFSLFLIYQYIWGDTKDYSVLVLIFGLFFLLWIIPVIYFHVTYYISNRGLSIDVNYDTKTFTITKNGITKNYSFSDITHSEKNLNLYYKKLVDNVYRRASPWCGYHYIKFRLKDGTQIFLTSLMTDILNCNYECVETHYTLFPFLRQKDWQTIDYSDWKDINKN